MATKQVLSPMLQEILKLKHAEPFRPFQIETSAGDRYVIMKGERLGRSPSGNVVSFFAKGEAGHRTLKVSDIVAARPLRRTRRGVTSPKR